MSAAAPLAAAGNGAGLRHWRLPALCLALALAVLGLVFAEPLAAMVAQWGRSETYAHSYLIGPIALWLLWRRRGVLEPLSPRPDALALLALLALSLGWLAGEAAGVLVLEQYAVTAMVPALVWLVGGRELLRAWGFPLAFLLLAVPFGGSLVPPLMELTADMTVALVRASGVPVYREGLFFSLPTGNWSVVEACSGIRYLIASVTLGLLYAYLAYYTLWRRLLFVALSVALPILANGLRAYGIVMLGHLSGMQLAVGVDHLIYGWLFFGLVMLLMFWIGRFWQESSPPPQQSPRSGAGRPAAAGRLVGVAGAGLLAVLLGPAWAAYTAQAGPSTARLELPRQLAGVPLQSAELPAGWQPHYVNASAEAKGSYGEPGAPEAGVFVGYYADQREGAELVAWENSLTAPEGQPKSRWRSLGRAGSAALGLPGGGALQVPAWRITDGVQQLVVWRWFWVDGAFLGAELPVKLRSAWARLAGGDDAGAVLAVAVPAREGQPPVAGAPVQLMQALAADMAARLPGASRE